MSNPEPRTLLILLLPEIRRQTIIQGSVPHPLRPKAPRESIKLAVHTKLVVVERSIYALVRA